MRDGRMHQTTVRFSPDLWDGLEEECSRLGVSVAQFLREAALARLAYTAGRRRDVEYAAAYATAGTTLVDRGEAAVSTAHALPDEAPARQSAGEKNDEAAAVSAQSELVWRRSRALREQAAELRRRRRGRPE